MSEETELCCGVLVFRHDTHSIRHFKTFHEVIQLAVVMYVRFPLSLTNVEDLLRERGSDVRRIDVSHEGIFFDVGAVAAKVKSEAA